MVLKKLTKKKKLKSLIFGSKQNDFWELFISSLKLKIEIDDFEGLKYWLEQNKWGITLHITT